MMEKKIAYAYETSELADQLGNPNGCYVFTILRDDGFVLSYSAHDTFDAAAKEAAEYNYPWSRYSMPKPQHRS